MHNSFIPCFNGIPERFDCRRLMQLLIYNYSNRGNQELTILRVLIFKMKTLQISS
jgi:hypothetical protein